MSTFAQILGQDAAVGWLATALAAERLPHALIFAGAEGVGKATTARALAARFLCTAPKRNNPCGVCESCRSMKADVHPDFHVVHRKQIRQLKPENKGTTLAAEVIRRFLNDKAHLKAVMGGGKVFVVEEAELMNPTAQNSLLKTLEEPPGNALIVLITTNVNLLLPTIRSRSQLVRFGRLPEELVAQELIQRGIPADDARDAAAITDGSLGLSLRWLQDGVIASARELARILDHLGAQSVPDLSQCINNAAQTYFAAHEARDANITKDTITREGLGIIAGIAANHLRRKLPAASDDPDRLDRLSSAIESVVKTERYLDSNVTISLTTEQLAVNLVGLLVH
ncbi:MAG TPA: DNA polymerase III subunit delta' [Tepidisphaeraceae bacterium]|nr:DNA polymerase III subunit delta' [Tepidisphaeraceae bacterium]